MTDYDGNAYHTIQLGNQCWMKENLRTTHYADGVFIPVVGYSYSTSTTTAYRYAAHGSESSVPTFGYLYNWSAVMNEAGSSNNYPSGVQGVCPAGWHVPSDTEWVQLTDYLSSQSVYVCGEDNRNIAKALAATTCWKFRRGLFDTIPPLCNVSYNPYSNNTTGFSAFPVADTYYSYENFGYNAYFWSATQFNESNANTCYLTSKSSLIARSNRDKGVGCSVRCLRNDGLSIPAISTSAVSSITGSSATCGGNVVYDGGDYVTVRGVCWSTSENPIVSDNHTTDGTGTGSFSNNISGLSPGTTYYVRAYATNSVGTNYGAQRTFTTLVIIPEVTTNAVSNITSTTATCGGNVTATGGASVTARGICWSTSQNPTVNNSHTSDGTGVGGFTSSMTGLLPNTTYYVRAYATNSAGTAYGTQQSFTTQTTVPTVTTNTVSSITSSTATCGGDVTSTGGVSVTARGVCWGTSQNPTVSDTHTTNGTGSGSFTSSITGLAPGTTYYVRAYATNSVGTSYGEQRSFTTLDNHGQTCSGVATVTDIDNNTYNTVKIGNQCWMKENLRTTHYANGESIALGSSTSTTTAYRYNPNNNSSNVGTYGYLYNWAAVMHGASSSSANPSGRQGVCPNGWHVPSDAEWTQLTNYVKGQSQYQCNNNYWCPIKFF